jgi:DNA modification methylase
MSSFRNEIITGDARELAKSIPDNSVDLIFTDPPYPKEFLPLYGWLAQEAARVLKPGGFLLTYVGAMRKYEVMLLLGKHLSFFSDYVSLEFGHVSMVHPRKLACMHKSILAFSKGNGMPRKYVYSVWKSTIEDKRYHSWGQNVSTASYYINCFSKPGDTVWEPFAGGGTTCYACKQLERDFIAFEIDAATAEIAQQRLATVQPLLMPEEVQYLDLWEELAV